MSTLAIWSRDAQFHVFSRPVGHWQAVLNWGQLILAAPKRGGRKHGKRTKSPLDIIPPDRIPLLKDTGRTKSPSADEIERALLSAIMKASQLNY